MAKKMVSPPLEEKREVYRVHVYEDDSYCIFTLNGALRSVDPNPVSITLELSPNVKPSLTLRRASTPPAGSELTDAEKAIQSAHLAAQSPKRKPRPSRTGVVSEDDTDLYPLDGASRGLLIESSDLRCRKPSKLVSLDSLQRDDRLIHLVVPKGDSTEILDVERSSLEVADIQIVTPLGGEKDSWNLSDSDHRKRAVLEMAGAENVLASQSQILVVAQVEQPAFTLLNRSLGTFNCSETLRVWSARGGLTKDELEEKISKGLVG
jgi:hypothetical protein